jgi:predicted nucleic acid-binding Zn ribbon protein
MIETNFTTNKLEQFRVVPAGIPGEPRGHCTACGDHIWTSGGYRIPGLAGLYCGMLCIEAGLFGLNHCRWCGHEMDKPYTSIESRLCSEDCSANYWAHVKGDSTAELGTGKRFLSWLQREQPLAYREIVSGGIAFEGFCRNPNCKRGEDGKPASLAHLRAGTRFCSETCKKQAARSPNPQKPASKTPVFIGFSRDTSPGKAFPLNPGKTGVSRHTLEASSA